MAPVNGKGRKKWFCICLQKTGLIIPEHFGIIDLSECEKWREKVLTIYFGMAAFLCAGSLLWGPKRLGQQEKTQHCLQTIFLLLAGFLFVAVATCRHGIGYDYFNYQKLYEELGPLPVSELVVHPVAQEFLGYALFTRLTWILGLDYRGLLLVVNLALTAIVLWFVRRFSPLPWLSLYLYLTLQFFAHSMNLFRQSIAATICLLAYPFLKKRNFLGFVGVVLVASSFHLSVLFFLPFYWVLNWKLNGRLLAVLGGAAALVYLFSNQTAQFLTQYLFPNYAGYIGSRYWSGLGYRYMILPALYFVAVWLFRRQLIQQEESNRQLIQSAFYVFLLYGFSTHHMILERFSIYLFFYAIILLPKLVVSFTLSPNQQISSKQEERRALCRQRKHRNEMAAIAMVMVVLFGFSYLIFASEQGKNGFHKVYPYVSIWDNRG